MKSILFCLKDDVAETFLPPFNAPTVGAAIRAVGDEVARGGAGNAVATHPKDFSLYQVGMWDSVQGQCEPGLTELICSADQCRLTDG